MVVSVEDAAPAEDPRKALWAEAARLKERAVAMGAAAEGVTAWMEACIVDEAGAPKDMRSYTADDVAALRDHLLDVIDGMAALEAQRAGAEADALEADGGGWEQPSLADEDIAF